MATTTQRRRRPKGPRRPKRAILLCRISDGRDPDRVAINLQKRDGYRYGNYLGWGFGPEETHLVIEDGVSAYKRKRVVQPDGSVTWRTDRPKYREVLDMLDRGEADGLIAYNLDRTIRDPYDLEDLIGVVYMRSPKIPVQVVTGSMRLANDDDIAMARTLVAFANKSSGDTGRRVARTRRNKAEQGKFNGGVRRFGRGVVVGTRMKRVRDKETDTVREVEVDVLDMNQVREEEAEQIEKAVDDLLAGVSFKEAFRNLVASGVKPVKAARWSERSFRQVLLSPHIAGLATYNGTSEDDWDPYTGDGEGDDDEDHEHDGDDPDGDGDDEEPEEEDGDEESREPLLFKAEWPEIVSREKWEAVRDLLTDPARRTTTGGAPKWLGSLIYRCGRCRDELREEVTLTVGKGGDGRRRREDGPTRADAGAPGRKRRAPTYVCPRHFHLAHKAEELDDFVERVIIERLSREDAADLLRHEALPEEKVTKLREELVALGQRKRAAARQFASDVIDEEQLAEISATVRDRTAQINRTLERALTRSPLADIAGRPDAAEVWKSRDMGRRRAILRELFTVTILPASRPGARGFDPERVVIEPRREPAENS